MKPIPIDSGDFVKIRTAKPQLLYVDKTAYFHRMITAPQASNFFLARPRRFGKSLMITTLKAIFQGQRRLFKDLAALYASVPYGSTEKRVHESSYSRNLVFLLKGQGIICNPEVRQSDGRADLVADHPCGTYIFELKVGKSAKLASTQAQRKRYAAPYAAAGKSVWVIGLAFSKRTRRLVDHCVAEYRPRASKAKAKTAAARSNAHGRKVTR